jgi:hypothetical protein
VKRWHLFELEDQAWVPRVLRDNATDILDWMFARMGMYRPVVGQLQAAVAAAGERDIVDICSGGAGGALAMHGYLREQGGADTRLLLTDRYPNRHAAARVAAAGDPTVRYHGAPVDALAVPTELRGVRTMYSALHHFRPAAIEQVIGAAVADRAPIAFFDIAAQPALRRVPGFLVPLVALFNIVMLLVLVPLMVPFVRPFRWSRLLFTYVIPLVPILYAWDGTVSLLRAYAHDELAAIARKVPGAETYTWSSGRAGSGMRSVVYLIGQPGA